MRKLVLACLCLFGMLAPALADGPWSGTWQVTWPGGGAFVLVQQDGGSVHGAYRNGRGQIEAMATGDRIEGKIIHGDSSETFTAILSPDGNGFSGRTATGDWLSGLRAGTVSDPISEKQPDLSSPRAAMQSFLDAANLAREGHPQALALAVDTIDFGDAPEWSANGPKFQATEQLYLLINLATFPLSVIPDGSASPRISISLPTLGKDSAIPVDFARGTEGTWQIVMPSLEALDALVEKHQEALAVADAFRQLASPRDTLLTYFHGMAHWKNDGGAEAISTLNLSEVPEVLKAEQGRIVAQYLIRTIDRTGGMLLQSVPNAGGRQQPFVYFEHPAGRIVIEPIETGKETRWQFSAETVSNARRLFAAVQALPNAHAVAPSLIPSSSMFAIREMVEAYAPALLRDVAGRGRIEYWQLLVALMTVALMVAIALILRKAAAWLISYPWVNRYVHHPKLLALTVGIIPALASGIMIMPHIGMPAATRQYSVPIIGTLFTIIIIYAIWQLVGIISAILDEYAQRTKTEIDNILVTFVAGVARLALLAAGGLLFGSLWSLPTTGILAGLGIGGLAVAFASKETLANVFGAGILLGDRPFRKGDQIRAGDVNGWVEAVGLRSTRIRTFDDSLVIVPNGKLADNMIDNLGARRRRALTARIVVTSGSTPEKLKAFTRAIADRIASDAMFDRMTEVNVVGITSSGIEIEIMSAINTTSGNESRAETHQLFLDIMTMAEAEGLTLGRGMEKNPVYVLKEA